MKPSRNQPHKLTPETPLTPGEVDTLIRLMIRHELSVYQRLYAVGLTSPGKNGRPFGVQLDPEHSACVRVTPQGWSGYAFSVPARDVLSVVERAEALYAVLEQPLKHPLACCPVAEVAPCVCDVSFRCAVHGGKCHGSHD